ncbi:Copper transport protein CTR3 [Spathaspora sp. JA1]|nr:Copper transport protein CTR3 [Spathaspora sp. JA1]
MDMGGHNHAAPAKTCKISMLWNWYTIDSCFLARSWHVSTKAQFAGSCIGVFLLCVVGQWLHRFSQEYDAAIVRRNQPIVDCACDDSDGGKTAIPVAGPSNPLLYAFSHNWFANPAAGVVASPMEHLVRSFLFVVEWGLAYLIMLFFMYYNGYIIISCLLGAFVGKLIFAYRQPLAGQNAVVTACGH